MTDGASITVITESGCARGVIGHRNCGNPVIVPPAVTQTPPLIVSRIGDPLRVFAGVLGEAVPSGSFNPRTYVPRVFMFAQDPGTGQRYPATGASVPDPLQAEIDTVVNTAAGSNNQKLVACVAMDTMPWAVNRLPGS